MKKTDYLQIKKSIIKLLGEKSNVKISSYCEDCFCFMVKDKSLIEKKKIRSLSGVKKLEIDGKKINIQLNIEHNH